MLVFFHFFPEATCGIPDRRVRGPNGVVTFRSVSLRPVPESFDNTNAGCQESSSLSEYLTERYLQVVLPNKPVLRLAEDIPMFLRLRYPRSRCRC